MALLWQSALPSATLIRKQAYLGYEDVPSPPVFACGNTMIRFSLRCDKGHEFEAWFRNGATYDRQAKRAEVLCPDCGSAKVMKAIMAPAINRGGAQAQVTPVVADRSAPATAAASASRRAFVLSPLS